MTVGDFQVSRVFPVEQKKQGSGVEQTRPSGIKREQSERVLDRGDGVSGESFSKVLEKEFTGLHGLRFSAHALRRMKDRDIVLSSTELSRLNSGVQRVQEKGARDSLILLDDMAYIVSVRNRMVVTALNREATLDNVFTNIDSVAIV